jgi:hypothetical protein
MHLLKNKGESIQKYVNNAFFFFTSLFNLLEEKFNFCIPDWKNLGNSCKKNGWCVLLMCNVFFLSWKWSSLLHVDWKNVKKNDCKKMAHEKAYPFSTSHWHIFVFFLWNEKSDSIYLNLFDDRRNFDGNKFKNNYFYFKNSI